MESKPNPSDLAKVGYIAVGVALLGWTKLRNAREDVEREVKKLGDALSSTLKDLL